MRKYARHPQVPSSDIEKRPKRDINTLYCCKLTAPPTHPINKRVLSVKSPWGVYLCHCTNQSKSHTTMTSQFFSPCFTDFHSSLFPISPFTFSVRSSSVNVRLVLCCVYALHLGSQLSPLLKNCDLYEYPVTNTEPLDTMVLLLYCLSLRLFFIIRFLLCGLPSLPTFRPFSHVNVIKAPKISRCTPILCSNSISVNYTLHATESVLFLPQNIKTCIY